MNQPVPEPAPIIKDMRNMALNLKPEQIGLPTAPAKTQVWGVLMETGYPEVLVTLLVLADGTTSLYLGHGGGFIGAGEYANVRRASSAFLQKAESYKALHKPAMEFPYPNVGRVKFYLLTYSGILTADAAETELGNNRHRLSGLFYAGHDVITEIKRLDETNNWTEEVTTK